MTFDPFDFDGTVTVQTAPLRHYMNSTLWGPRVLSTGRPAPLIEGVLDRGQLVFLAGPSGAGKSFVALSLATAIAGAKDWFGHAVPERLPVLYVAAEGGYGIGQRLHSWSRHYGRPIPRELGVLGEPVPLSDPAKVTAFTLYATMQQPGLIIFDTLARSSGDWNENESRDMNRLTDVAQQLIRDTGATVLIVHHVSHKRSADPTDMRGSSALYANADAVLNVVKGDDPGTLDMFSTKRKDGPQDLSEAFELVEPVTPEWRTFTAPATSVVLVPRDVSDDEPAERAPSMLARAFHELHRAFGDDAISRHRMRAVLVDALECAPRTADSRITALHSDGALIRTGAGPNTRYAASLDAAKREYGYLSTHFGHTVAPAE